MGPTSGSGRVPKRKTPAPPTDCPLKPPPPPTSTTHRSVSLSVVRSASRPCFFPSSPQSSSRERKERNREEMLELFILGCTGVVILLHSAHFFFRTIADHAPPRSVSFLGAGGLWW